MLCKKRFFLPKLTRIRTENKEKFSLVFQGCKYPCYFIFSSKKASSLFPLLSDFVFFHPWKSRKGGREIRKRKREKRGDKKERERSRERAETIFAPIFFALPHPKLDSKDIFSLSLSIQLHALPFYSLFSGLGWKK